MGLYKPFKDRGNGPETQPVPGGARKGECLEVGLLMETLRVPGRRWALGSSLLLPSQGLLPQ